MNIFDKFFNHEIDLDDAGKADAVSVWLRKEYDVSVKDRNVLVAMLEIHEGANESKHFGHPEIASAFGKGIVQMVRFADGWHIVFTSPNHSKQVVLHPKSEAESYNHPINRKVVGEMRSLLKTGSLVTASARVPAAAERFIKEPTALVDGGDIRIVIPDESGEDDSGDLPFQDDASVLGGFLGGSGSSISIDVDPSSFNK